jgi:cobalt-zinc-cadmium efflux system membrane fusion protein
MVSVSFPVAAFLRNTELLPGSVVRKGQVIATMEDQALIQLQQDYLVGKEREVYLQQEYERQKQLNENNVNAAKVFQQVSADLNSHKVMMKGMEEKLRLIGIEPTRLSGETLSRSVPIRSPINGYVSKVMMNIGKYVQPGEVIFELIDPSDMHAALTIFQKDIPNIAIGQEVDINFIDRPQQHYKARIFLVTRNLDQDRSQLAHCHFIDDPGKLMPGMFLQARIRTSPRAVDALPEGAVVNYHGRTYVFAVTANGKFSMQEVETGSLEDGFIEIRNASGRADEKFVVRNAYALLGAMKNTGEDE